MAANPLTSRRGSPSNAPTGEDWADQITNLLVDTVDTVRDKTVRPAQKTSHALVYGLVIGVLALPTVIMLLVGAVRLIDQAIPGTVWIVYAIFGIVFSLAGIIIWAKKFK